MQLEASLMLQWQWRQQHAKAKGAMVVKIEYILQS
jgi:hypothetical protein